MSIPRHDPSVAVVPYFSFINRLVSQLIVIDDLNDALATISTFELPDFYGDVCGIYLADEKQELIQKAQCCSPRCKKLFSVNEITGSDTPLQVFEQKESVLKSANGAGEAKNSFLKALRMEVSVPILLGDRAVGVIYFACFEENFFQQEHLELAKTLALNIAAKLANSKTVERLRESVEQLQHAEQVQTALYEISSVTHAAKDLKELYRRLYQIVGGLIYTKNFYIALVDNEGQRITFPFFIDELDPIFEDQSFDFKQKEKTSLTGYLLSSREPLLILPNTLKETCEKRGIKHIGSAPYSWLGAPFFLNHLSGAVVVQSYDHNTSFTEKDKELLVYVASHVGDALERKTNEERLRHLALHDVLTSLPNRMLFYDRLKLALARHHRDKRHPVIIFFLDLDLFKNVNDQYGHLVGDELLKQIGLSIAECLRESDTLARFGGDEFAILLESLDREQALQIAERIINAVKKTFHIDDHKINTSTSIGIAFANDQTRHPDHMIGMADQAMYQAKSKGPGIYQIFGE
ncbi:diguanylate cyclase domain-containing protein [Motiliproteus sp. MSK22-1]|uniref:diguanylate cyclase domain-containing protein n=1 Tax=Motiliproteus sp. MSK22-1 TaxID=1897630 RepID=UPI000975CE54|nr:diguanylate cyclase [Motiliproteus sp. MSK22-1]OMH33881.1 hypothetical protein BGP75_12945 [Motiliproteus sp. MSK22-1]